ncbi:MAG: beta-galactosidase [Planctomycetes bacterium]|nr:beta-galactosidase [Planctomycetota bacterium]
MSRRVNSIAPAAVALVCVALAGCRSAPAPAPPPSPPSGSGAPASRFHIAVDLAADPAAPPAPIVLRIPPGEPLRLLVRAPAGAAGIEALAYDAYGRIWGRGEADRAPSSGDVASTGSASRSGEPSEATATYSIAIPTDLAIGDAHELVVQTRSDPVRRASRVFGLRFPPPPGSGFTRILVAADPLSFAAGLGGAAALGSFLRENGARAMAFPITDEPASRLQPDWLRDLGLPFVLLDVVPTGWDNGRLDTWGAWDGLARPGWDDMVRAATEEGARPEETLLRVPCLRDPGYRDRARRRLHAVLEALAPLRPAFIDVASELSFGSYTRPLDLDFDPRTLDAFRRRLYETYRTLASLNSWWGTSFRRWEEVLPATAVQIETGGAAAPGLPAWAEFRAFIDEELATHLDQLRAWVQEIEPDLPVGATGIQKPASYGGYDPERLAEALDVIAPYEVGNMAGILASIAPERPLYSIRSGAEGDPWVAVARGFRGEFLYWLEGLFDVQDKRPVPHDPKLTDRLREEALALDGGLPRFWLAGRRRRSAIAIHASQASARGLWWLLPERPGPLDQEIETEFDLERRAWCRILQDLGHDPEFLTRAAIEGGALDPSRFRVLILPLSIAISDREAEAIMRFCAGGGRIIADGLTGWMDERCAVRRVPALDPLFGIERRAFAPAPFTHLVGLIGRDEYWGSAFPDLFRYARLIPVSDAGRAIGEVALAPIERDVEPGLASRVDYRGVAASEEEGAIETGAAVIRSPTGNWFLNGRVLSYRYRFEADGEEGFRGRPTLRLTIPPEPSRDPPIRRLVARILDDAGVRPLVRLIDPESPDARPAVRTILRERNGTIAVALLPADPEAPSEGGDDERLREDLRLVGDEMRWWVLARKGRRLGTRNVVPIPRPGDGVEFAVGFPEPVDGVRVDAPAQVSAGDPVGLRVEIRAASGMPCRGFFVVRRRVFLPDGRIAPWDDRWLEIEDGLARDWIPIAYNAPLGRYVVEYREAVTGETARASIEVGSAPRADGPSRPAAPTAP